MRAWFVVPIAALAAVLLLGETPGGATFTATTANIASAPDPVRIEILRWSTDEERDRLMAAWNLRPGSTPGPTPGTAKGAGKQGKGGGKGAGKGPAPGSGSGGAAAATQTPETALTNALQEATTVGYLWSSEVAGYALRYAGKVANPDGSQRIILITQRKLGSANQLWKPTADGPSNAYDFSVIELHLNAKGDGEGKVSLTGKVAPDAAAKIVTIENYNALPVVFREVRKRAAQP